jgi:hypothetical protein
MKRAYGLVALVFFASALGGCGGSAAPASPVVPGAQPAAQSVPGAQPAAQAASQGFGNVADPENAYPHILISAVPPGRLEGVKDGQSITLVTTAKLRGRALSLEGAQIHWSGPEHGTLVPSEDGQTAVYTAPLTGSGHDVVMVRVHLDNQWEEYSAHATIQYKRN